MQQTSSFRLKLNFLTPVVKEEGFHHNNVMFVSQQVPQTKQQHISFVSAFQNCCKLFIRLLWTATSRVKGTICRYFGKCACLVSHQEYDDSWVRGLWDYTSIKECFLPDKCSTLHPFKWKMLPFWVPVFGQRVSPLTATTIWLLNVSSLLFRFLLKLVGVHWSGVLGWHLSHLCVCVIIKFNILVSSLKI